MQLRKEEEILGVVITSLIEGEEGMCPTDEEFALYLERRLNKDEREALISHFVSCRECRERLAVPIYPLETVEEPNAIKKFLSFLWRPLVLVPIAVFLIVSAISLSFYLKSQNFSEERYEERYRSANLVALEQVELTPALLATIKESNKEKLKNELIEELPPDARVSHIFVEDKLRYLEKPEEGDRVILILYANGLLKVKLE